MQDDYDIYKKHINDKESKINEKNTFLKKFREIVNEKKRTILSTEEGRKFFDYNKFKND